MSQPKESASSCCLISPETFGTSEGVAREIFDAATDETDRLATKDIIPLVALRRSRGEDEYINTMRGRFGFGVR